MKNKYLDDISETNPHALKADGFDDAIIGIGSRCAQKDIIAYDVRKCLTILMERDGMTEEEAQEFFDFNVVGAWVGDDTPIFIYS